MHLTYSTYIQDIWLFLYTNAIHLLYHIYIITIYSSLTYNLISYNDIGMPWLPKSTSEDGFDGRRILVNRSDRTHDLPFNNMNLFCNLGHPKL